MRPSRPFTAALAAALLTGSLGCSYLQWRREKKERRAELKKSPGNLLLEKEYAPQDCYGLTGRVAVPAGTGPVLAAAFAHGGGAGDERVRRHPRRRPFGPGGPQRALAPPRGHDWGLERPLIRSVRSPAHEVRNPSVRGRGRLEEPSACAEAHPRRRGACRWRSRLRPPRASSGSRRRPRRPRPDRRKTRRRIPTAGRRPAAASSGSCGRRQQGNLKNAAAYLQIPPSLQEQREAIAHELQIVFDHRFVTVELRKALPLAARHDGRRPRSRHRARRRHPRATRVSSTSSPSASRIGTPATSG